MENKTKHLEFIQSVISRMASNLFFLKGWSITLIAGVFVILVERDINKFYMFLVYIPLVTFWILDGYFLSLEKAFRNLYDEVRVKDKNDIDFSMKIDKYKKKNGWLRCMFTWTLFWFYAPIGTGILIIIFLSK